LYLKICVDKTAFRRYGTTVCADLSGTDRKLQRYRYRLKIKSNVENSSIPASASPALTAGGTSQNSRRERDEGFKQIQHRRNRYPDQTEREKQKPDDGIQQKRQQRQRPSQD